MKRRSFIGSAFAALAVAIFKPLLPESKTEVAGTMLHIKMPALGRRNEKSACILATDMHFLESRKFTKEEIALAFGVPAHLIDDTNSIS